MLYRIIVYHILDIGHVLQFLVQHSRTTAYKTSVFPQAIRLWNKLPAQAVEAKTLDSFKTQLSAVAQP
jgi:hypothetical protein